MSRTLSRRALFRGRRPSQEDAATTVRRVATLAASCLAVNGTMCSVCADPCEPRALRVRPLLGGRALPMIDVATCTGCGECLTVCPVGALALVPAAATSEDAQCV